MSNENSRLRIVHARIGNENDLVIQTNGKVITANDLRSRLPDMEAALKSLPKNAKMEGADPVTTHEPRVIFDIDDAQT